MEDSKSSKVQFIQLPPPIIVQIWTLLRAYYPFEKNSAEMQYAMEHKTQSDFMKKLVNIMQKKTGKSTEERRKNYWLLVPIWFRRE